MAVVDYHQGAPVRAWRSLRQAEDAAQDLGDRSLLAACRQEMGRFLVERANLDAAVHLLELARQDYALVQDGQGQADCCWLLGRVAKQSGDLGLAMSRFSESLDAFEQMGHRWGVALCTNELGEIARLQGDLESAELLYRDALERMMELGCDDVAVVRMNLGIVLQDHGRYEEAGTQLEVALQAWVRSGHRAMIGTAHVLLLSCAAAAGEWETWDLHLGGAMQGLAETGFVDRDVAAAAHRAGDLAWRAGQQARARAIFSLAAAQWRALDRPRELAEASARLEEA
jgi:tetratricopeptide (TPR) repeat protein